MTPLAECATCVGKTPTQESRSRGKVPCCRALGAVLGCVGVVAGQPHDTTFARVVPATCRSSHRLVSAMPPGTSPSSERFSPTCTHSSPCPPAGRCRVSAYVSFAPVVFRSVACRTVFHWRREAGYMKLIQTIPNILEVVCKRVPPLARSPTCPPPCYSRVSLAQKVAAARSGRAAYSQLLKSLRFVRGSARPSGEALLWGRCVSVCTWGKRLPR